MGVLLILAATFLVCYLVDKGFSKVFRGKAQHKTGLSVRLNKRYASMGVVLTVLGVAAVFAGIDGQKLLLICGSLVIVLGIALVVYYLTFGVFYDEDSFILTTFGKKSVVYHYREIQSQQLYNTSGGVVIELYMKDGRAVQLQAGMLGVYPFLDTAFAGWLRQTGRREEDCDFHDPQNSCWFPPVEG